MAGNMACAVRRAAALGIAERGLGIWNAADDHAVVQQGQHHGQQGAFLAAVQRRCAGEYGGRLADEFCAEPKGNGAVDKVFHCGGHIAETCWAAERKAGAIFEVVGSRVWRAFVWNGFFNGFANGGNFGNSTQHGFATVHAFDTACDLAGKVARAAILGIKEDEDFQRIWVHLGFPLQCCQVSDGLLNTRAV